MKKLLLAATLLTAATTAALAAGHSRNALYDFAADQNSAYGAVTLVNAPGGDYIQCDPRNPSSPVRCKADSW